MKNCLMGKKRKVSWGGGLRLQGILKEGKKSRQNQRPRKADLEILSESCSEKIVGEEKNLKKKNNKDRWGGYEGRKGQWGEKTKGEVKSQMQSFCQERRGLCSEGDDGVLGDLVMLVAVKRKEIGRKNGG